MKKSIFLFFAAILCSLSAGAATERVYFVNASNWSTINVHAWEGTATGTSWPGNPATQDTWQWEGKDVYYFEAEAGAYKKCIFNNGNGQQTADLSWTANQVYDHNSQSWLPVEVAQATTTGTTVYFVNTENWNPVNVYAFSKYPSEINNSWPGVAATKESYQIGGFDVYSYKITKEFDYCIFNNGSQQSADLPWYQGKYYAPSKNTWYDDKAAAEEALAVPVDDVTVYFINTAGWDEVACHHWLEGVSGTTWPGDVLTKGSEQIAGYDVYTATFSGEHTKCIFNNNNNGSQTGDLDVQDGKYYALSTETWYDTPEAAAEALAVPIPDVTVYFVNTKSWTTVNAYVFVGSNSYKGWPGEAMTKTGDQAHGYDVYSYTFPETYISCIFNNGSTQTEDLTTNAGKYYDMASKTWYTTLAEVPNPTPPVMETVYFINTGEWEKVHVHAWKDGVNNGWPGAELAKNGETVAGFDVYSFEAEQGQWANIIFNCGGDECKTGDLTWEAGKYYAHSTGEWYADAATAEAALAAVVTYDYYIAGNEALLGADKNWGSTPAGKGMDKGADGLYTATFTLSANTEYEFKITDGQWNSESDNSHEHTTLAAVYVGVTGGNGNNIKVNLAEAKELTITFNSTEDKIYFNLDEETASLTYRVQVPEGTEACYIAGPCNSWAFREMTREGTTDIFTIDIVGAKETDEYKYSCKEDWAYAEVREADENGNSNRKAWTALDEVTEWGKPADPAEVKCYLMGNGDWDNGVEMTLNPDNDNEYMLLDHYISAPFKFKLGDEWSDQVENYDFPGIDWVDSNITLPEGYYDFYFKKDIKKAYIAAVYLRDVTNTWGTICLPHASTNFSGAKFYEVSSLDPTKGLWLDEIEAGAQLVAGKPYVFEATASTIKVTYTDAAVADPVAGKNGLTGTFTDIAAGGALVGNYIIAENKVWVAGTGATLPANCAYIANTVPTTEQPQLPGRRRVCMGENAATGLDQIVAPEGQAVKAIVNGQLIIIRDGVKYNVQGQKL